MEWWHIVIIGISLVFLVTLNDYERDQEEEEKENKLIKKIKREFQKED